jgi:hypothetical protein
MSAATFHQNLRSAVRDRLQSLTGLPDVAWEGREFTPVKGEPYVTESIIPVSSDVMATGLGGYIAHTVTANFTLHYPVNSGTVALESLAGSIMQHFRPGTVVSYSGTAATVQQVERVGLTQEPDWLNGTVIVTMIGHTIN